MASIPLKLLADICHRTATAHAAGVDARKIWQREAQQGPPAKQRQFQKVSEAIDGGSTLADALKRTEGYLPPLVHDMVHVGERTGKVDESLNRLGGYYEHLRSVRAGFLVGIAWPTIQLVMALLIIGLVIWLMGFIQQRNGSDSNIDILGLGLMGTSGAITYFAIVGVMLAVGGVLLRSLVQGRLSSMVMTPLMRLPKVGRWLQVMAMSRMTWALGMAVESGMDAMQSTDVALRSTQNRYFSDHGPALRKSIQQGETLHDAYSATGVFPVEFLDAVQVGEETGRLAESMEKLSRRYEELGKAAMQAMAVAMGVVVWGGVAMLIIFFIFRIASFYFGLLQSVIDGTF